MINEQNEQTSNTLSTTPKVTNQEEIKNEKESPPLNNNTEKKEKGKEKEDNPVSTAISLLLDHYSYNSIIDSMIKSKNTKSISKFDNVIDILINLEGYANFIKKLLIVKKEKDAQVEKIPSQEEEQKQNQSSPKKTKLIKKSKKYNKQKINMNNSETSYNNDFDSSNLSSFSNIENYRKKHVYSLRPFKNINNNLYIESISYSKGSNMSNIIDDFEISIDEGKKNSEKEKSKNKEIIDLSDGTEELKKKARNKINESFDIDIEYESNNPHEIKDRNANRQKYYKKGGKFGMHYYLSNEDKKIYKYYSVQYNGDNSIGFRCTDINCKSRAVLNPKNKEFKILTPHTLEFEKHLKLIGCYKTDKFIKSMEMNKFKEIQLTKKDNKKIILWYK